MRLNRSTCIVVGICLAGAVSAFAQQPDGANPAAAIAPFLDEQTIGVVRIDATRVDVDAIAAQITLLPMLSKADRAALSEQKKHVGDWLDRFRRAGGRELYFVVSFADELQKGPFVVVPLHPGSDAQSLSGLFVTRDRKGPPGPMYPYLVDAAFERDGALILGSNQQVKRLKEFKGPARPVSKETFDAVAESDIQVFLLPNDDHRRVLSEFLRDPNAEREIFARMPWGVVPPELLRDRTGIAHLALTDGLQWIAIGIKTQGTRSAKLVIGSKDAASAQAINLWIAALWQVVKQNVAAEKGRAPAESAKLAVLIDQLARMLKPKVEGNRLTVRIDANELTTSALGMLAGQASYSAVQNANLGIVTNKLKQLALAMHLFHDANKHFPPAALRDKQGKPLLSWRVSLLPYLGEKDLYEQFHLDEPWDSAHNAKLIEKMPDVFAPASDVLRAQGKTTFLVPVGRGTIFGPKDGVTIKDITDGTFNTILIVNADAEQAVLWTKPEDLRVDVADVKGVLVGSRKDGFSCASADGAVHFVGSELDEALLRAILTRNGGEIVQWPER